MTEPIHLVARHSLAGSPDPDSMDLDDRSWATLLAAARQQRLTGMLAAMVAEGVFLVTDEQAEELAQAHLDALARDLWVERSMLWAVDVLAAEGLDHRVLKGPAVAHLDYAEPALRSFVDVDLLIRSEEWDRAIAALQRAGAERMYPEPRPGWDRRFGNGTVLTSPDRVEIDAHRTFVFGRFGHTLRLGELWAGAETFEVGGQTLKALAAPARWLQACFSAALGDIPARLVPLRDVLQLAGADGFDVDAARGLTERSGATAVVHRAIQLATGTLGVAAAAGVGAWMGEISLTRRDREALRPYLGQGDRWVPLAVSGLRAVPGARAKVAYASGLLWPDRAYLEPRYKGRVARWRSAGTRLLAARSR